MSSMKRLVSKIIDQFSHEAIIEIYVLDEAGKPLELYSGMPTGLTSKFFEEVLTKPSTFYCFSVVGIDETFADLLDIHRDKMSRKEFCWLTDPLPPTLVKRTDTSIALSFDLVDFCGVDVEVVEDCMEYVLEGCVGRPWVPGVASKFVSDIANSDSYKVLARGPKLSDVVVNDLMPSHWYHFRVCVQYMGTWVTSASKPFATLCARPSKPKQPSVYFVVNGNDMFLNRNRVDPQIRLRWGPPNKNGQEINKYHIQVREYTDEDIGDLQLTASSVGTEESEVFDGNDVQDDDAASNVMVDEGGNRLVGSKWRTVYCNLVNEVVLPQPGRLSKAWACRMRALNAHGWSDFCDPLILDHTAHPNLFKVPELPASPRQLPPLNQPADSSSSSKLDTLGREKSLQSTDFTNKTSAFSDDDKGAPSLLLPAGSPSFHYEMNPEQEMHWLDAFPDKKMAEVLEPEVDLLWAWTNINKDFIRYVVASAVCDTGEHSENPP